ncbi:Transcriptional regulator BlaI [Actinomadura sp. RB99]|uniref:BlaI/MecI/CopY family transcriptional regulator n=1 Tax=Actinomadura sp. RB99 TaxID=2691577 RepID=UPI0019B451F9|nr:Transcriptional regulator BlaI [Actinomadura sp. RB99]
MLGSLESQIMEVFWTARRPLTVRETLDLLNADRTPPLAYTTVLTVMSRLAEKGALVRKAQGRGHTYAPAAEDEAALAVQGVLRTYGDAAVSHFLDQAATDPDLRKRLQALLEKDS